MDKLKILNSREIKKVKNTVISEFGCFLKRDYAYLISKKNKIFIINKDISKLNLNNLKIDRVGLYFAEYYNEQVRLSKEGAQLLVRENNHKIKNQVNLDKEEIKSYFLGQDIEKDLSEKSKFVILFYKKNILGCAKYKNKKIINYLPKIHRGEVMI